MKRKARKTLKGRQYIERMPRLPGDRLLTAARRWLDRQANSLPSQCAVCRSWPCEAVCSACLARFAHPVSRCPGCAQAWAFPAEPGARAAPARCPDCLREPLPLDGCLAALDYAYPWSRLMQAFKFEAQTGWAGFFAERLRAEPGVDALLRSLEPQDWVLPLPLSAERLAERGYNQAWELAQALHRQCQCSAGLDAGLLLRLEHTAPQSALDRAQRLSNVRGAFAADPLRRQGLAGRQVVLVDDVMTSGASLAAAAQALRSAGAHSVFAVVVARTPA